MPPRRAGADMIPPMGSKVVMVLCDGLGDAHASDRMGFLEHLVGLESEHAEHAPLVDARGRVVDTAGAPRVGARERRAAHSD